MMGAATWGDGTTGISGFISSSNSLVGVTAGNPITGDSVSSSGVYLLTNGNYVVSSNVWSGQKGAVTFGNGATGISGTISASNSLVGSTGGDFVGSFGVVALTGSNGNYVVRSPSWGGGKGAATWGNGTTGISGAVSSSNSLVGSAANDAVSTTGTSAPGVIALTNGNYVVATPSWNGSIGAATWGNGTTGISGTISSSNSLIGTTANDKVGYFNTLALANGNYVVGSPFWHGKMGAVTWGNGTTGTSGVVSSSNSLVGSTADSISTNGDQVGIRVVTLTNGNYVVASFVWNAQMGAATWGNGTTGTSGAVSSSNSLVGSTALSTNTAGDLVGRGVVPLTNGNYVVSSAKWNGSMGAATWGDGTTGISGTISSSNSLVGTKALVGGSTTGDQVGSGLVALANGNYFVASSGWNSNMGAATWGNGTKGISGTILSSNSLVGTLAGDQVANNEANTLTNGDYVLGSSKWTNGSVTNAGAVTYISGTNGTPTGMITAANSVLGSIANDINYGYDYVPQSQRLYVGRQQSKTLSYLTIYFVPTVTSIAPASGTALGGTSVTITGKNFIGATGVTIGGSPATNVVVVNTTTITCTTPLGTAGKASVVVATPAGSNAANTLFMYINPAPTLTSISPSTAAAGSANTTITLTGTNFVSGSTANLNGTAIATTFVSATSLTAVIPAANLATAGTAPVTVTNAAPGGGTSSAQTFTVAAPNPAPTLTSINPTSVTAGVSDTTITLTGTNFVSTSTANLNGTAIATAFVSATSLTAVIPAANLAAPGTLSVTVVNAAPGGGTSAAQTFTVSSSLSLDSTMTGNVLQDVSGNISVVTTPPDAIVTWDFGDGTPSVMGHNVSHVYATPGTYMVTITIQDPKSGATITKTVMSTVAGIAAKAPGILGGTTEIRVRHCTIKLGPAKNSISMHTTLFLGAREVVSGSTLTVSINGVTKSFVLDRNGRANDATGTLNLVYRASAVARNAPLIYTLTGSDFATLLKTGVAVDASGLPIAAVCTFAINGRTLSFVTPVTFKTYGTTKIATFGLN